MSENKWKTAYLFSSFAKKTYHFNNPGGQGVVETEDALYRWELLLYHYKCCYNSGRRKEAAATRAELKACMQSHPEYFSYKDLVYIQSNSAFYLSLRNLRRWVKNRFAA
jgi:hypothetical protein